MPGQVYKTIYADPPWFEHGGGKIKRGADRHYPLMKTPQIIALKDFITSLADPSGCHLYLWVTNNHLEDGLKVMKEWGFRYVTKITWVKEGNIGLGQYFRGRTEDCLFGVLGKVPYKIINGKRQQGVTAFSAPKREHSHKPDEMAAMIERVSFGPYIELFAREPRDGWDTWGMDIKNWMSYGSVPEAPSADPTEDAQRIWVDLSHVAMTAKDREKVITFLQNYPCDLPDITPEYIVMEDSPFDA